MSHHYLLIGGNSGIGLALARRLHARGHQLTTAVRQPGPLQDLGAHVMPFDALQPSLFDSSQLPTSLDGLVYCPGTIRLKPFHRLTSDDFLDDFKVHVLGAAQTIQAALPALKSSSQASIVLFSTVAVTQGMPFHASVAAAKGAIEGLTRSLAAEFAPRIRVNAIAPTLTDTPLASPLLHTEAKRDAATKRHPSQLIPTADQIASLAEFLLSPSSLPLTGQILHPDAGLSSIRLFS